MSWKRVSLSLAGVFLACTSLALAQVDVDSTAGAASESQLKLVESDEFNPNAGFVPLSDGSSRAIGDTCATPIVVSIPAQLPYSDLNQTTCARVNDYANTCLGSYDGGEDIIYQLDVTASTAVLITMNPKTTTYTGILLDNICPPNITTCLAKVSNSGTALRTIGPITLAAGTYYIMCDTWPSPTCIANFDLSITAPPPSGACCWQGVCTSTIQANCTGVWLGPDTVCTPNPCPAARPCASCTPPNVNLDPIGNVPWYVLAGNCSFDGKWAGEFTGVVGTVYHFDLCPDTPGAGTANFDIDVKICDAACTILAGQDGACTALSYRPNDFQWTCTTAGTYYVILAPYSSYASHTCTGTAASTFTLNYYAEVPVLGACCLASGLCAQKTLAQCTTLGGTYQGDLVPCDPALCPVVTQDPCPGALFNQPPCPSTGAWAFVTSDSNPVPPYVVFDNFDVTAPICDVTWWGVDLLYNAGWFECDQVCPKFEIKFYADDGTGKPNIATPVCTYQLGATVTLDGLYGTYQMKKYQVGLNPCCVLPAGWISIQGIDADTCWFMWLNSVTGGDDIAWQYNGTTWTDTTYKDQALCLTGDYVPTPGACCIDIVCYDNLSEFECLYLCGIWYPGVGCDPTPCEPFGACCFTSGTCSYLTPSQCAAQSGTYLGDGIPCSPNPCPQPPGEVCSSAWVISALPFADSQDTTLFLHNYDEQCTFTGSTSKDVVYSYTPAVDEQVTIDLCTSAYDTKVYVYQDYCQELSDPNAAYACNDDYACTLSYRSHLECLLLPTGHTYYVVVDGYGGASGVYNLEMFVCVPTGACCFASGTCTVLGEADCLAQSGQWQGAGTVCSPNPCPQPTVACCFPDGSCQDLIAADCTAAGGSPKPYPSECATYVCPQPPPNDNCVDAIDVGPLPTIIVGDSTLATEDVPMPPGCDPSNRIPHKAVWYTVVGTGNTITASLCGGATWDTVIDVYCGTCETLTCVGGNDDFCGVQSEFAWCTETGRTYYVIVAAYSITGGGPFTLTLTDDGVPCLDPACAPTGACCVGEVCTPALKEVACVAQGGVWQGEGTGCDPNPCLPVTGACCIDFAGTCVIMTEADCLAATGRFRGVGTNCVDPATCGCKGDADCNGIIDFDDINPFVGSLSGAPVCNPYNCDIDNNGTIDFDDINPFVALLSTGAVCP